MIPRPSFGGIQASRFACRFDAHWVQPVMGFAIFDRISRPVYRRLSPLSSTAPDIVDSRVPQALSNVVMRCLAKNPAARYQRGNEVADALIQYLAQIGAPNPEKRNGWFSRSLPSFVTSS